jgi:transposase, IS30 family
VPEVVVMPGVRLSFEERCEIGRGVRQGRSLRWIAAGLGRPVSTVAREVRRNGGRWGYAAVRAQRRWHRTKRRPKAFKLERHPRLARRVERLLLRRWSPEQVAQRLRRDHPRDPRWWVSAETIYQSIYVQGRGALRHELHRHLRRRHPARKPQSGTGRLADMVMISERPAEARDRAVPGHWEGDLIEGAQASRSQIGMLTERTTRYLILFRLADKTATTVREALEREVRRLPEHVRRSLTWDQGKELAQHVRFTVDTGLQVYFCDPGHPWQRGTAENTVGLVRQYLPRGTSLAGLDRRALNAIATELNQRPRKTLGWDTPAEAYARLLVSQ